MSTSVIPVFDPQGTLRDVPQEQLAAAVKAGGTPAVKFIAPDKSMRYVPANRIQEAAAAGGQIQPYEDQADLDVSPPPAPSAFQRFGDSALTGAGVVSDEQGKNFFIHPLDTLKAMANLQGELGERAKKELDNKDYVRGLTHGVEWLLPGLGPTLARAGDQAEAGDYAGSAGTTLGAAATLLAGAKAPAIADAAGDVASAAASKGAAAVRATARGVNTALEKAPGTIGGTVGAAIGAKLGGATGAEFGGVAGAIAGKEILPQLRISGEGFGFPGRVTGGPSVIPKITPGTAGSMAESVAAPAVDGIAPSSAETEAVPAVEAEAPSDATIPRTLSGDAVLREELTKLPNKVLLQVARSRGIDVTPEAQLKPTNPVSNRIINKIVDDFSEDELDDVRNTRLEVDRMGHHDFGDIGKEANQTLNLQAYFPELKIPLAQVLRLRKVIASAGAQKFAPVTDLAQTLKDNTKTSSTPKPPTAVAVASEPVDDLTQILQESLKRVKPKVEVSQ